VFLMDCGNSTCKIVFDTSSSLGEQIRPHLNSKMRRDDWCFLESQTRFGYSEKGMLALEEALKKFIASIPEAYQHEPSFYRLRAITVCSSEKRERIVSILNRCGFSDIVWIKSSAQHHGFSNQYDMPEKLGVDRFVAGFCAWKKFPGKRILVVSAGTATTIDCIDPIQGFCGGMILPGIGTMLQSLEKRTTILDKRDMINLVDTIGSFQIPTNTQQAVRHGLIRTTYQSIVAATKDWQTQLCVATGGWLEALSQFETHNTLVWTKEPQLIFEGLRRWTPYQN